MISLHWKATVLAFAATLMAATASAGEINLIGSFELITHPCNISTQEKSFRTSTARQPKDLLSMEPTDGCWP